MWKWIGRAQNSNSSLGRNSLKLLRNILGFPMRRSITSLEAHSMVLLYTLIVVL